MDYLFPKNKELRDYLENQKEKIKKEIKGYSLEYFNIYSKETIYNKLKNYYEIIDIPQIKKDTLTMINERGTKRKEYREDFFGRRLYNSGEFYYVDIAKINCEVSFEGNRKWFNYHPNRYSSYENFYINKLADNSIYFTIEIELSVLEKEQDRTAYIIKKVNSFIEDIVDMLKAIEKDVNDFNKEISIMIPINIDKVFIKEKNINDIFNSIKIPLKVNKDAPNVKPIKLIPKKVQRECKNTIPMLEKEKNYVISDNDYENIKNIINLASIMMERTAQTFGELNEESLRDVTLSALNTHYEGMVNGEAFRKRGKTDIQIEFENKAAYIGECKIWYGKSKIEKSINQLFAYSTWRDTKGSLIYYVKIKDFNKVLEELEDYIKTNSKIISYEKISKNSWQCKIKEDSSTINDVNIVAYHLYYDKILN